jgi:hypothetical protein
LSTSFSRWKSGVAERAPFVTVHTSPRFSATSMRPPGRNATAVGVSNVTLGTAFSGTKFAGRDCAAAATAAARMDPRIPDASPTRKRSRADLRDRRIRITKMSPRWGPRNPARQVAGARQW